MQAAASGVGLFLVQLARAMSVEQVVGLAGTAERVRRLIYEGQTLVGFYMLALRPERIGESVAKLFELVREGRLKLFAGTSYPLAEAAAALEALSSRRTVGKIVLVP